MASHRDVQPPLVGLRHTRSRRCPPARRPGAAWRSSGPRRCGCCDRRPRPTTGRRCRAIRSRCRHPSRKRAASGTRSKSGCGSRSTEPNPALRLRSRLPGGESARARVHWRATGAGIKPVLLAASLLRQPHGLEESGRWFNPAARPGPGRAALECQPPPGTQSCDRRCAAREGAPRRDEREPLPLRRQTRKETRDQTTRGSLRPGCLRRARMAGSSERQSTSQGTPGSVARGAGRDPGLTKMVSDDYWKISVVQSPPWRRTSWARVGPSGRSWKSTKKSGSTSIPPSGEQFTRSSHERSAG